MIMNTTRRSFVTNAIVGGIGLAATSIVSPTTVAENESASSAEPIIDSVLPIVDAHHHLWFMPESLLRQVDIPAYHDFAPIFRGHARYLLDEFLADATSGHNVRASVFVEVGTMYRTSGVEALKSLGEVEFANGVAAMATSGLLGDVKVCAGIVGNANLGLGDAVQDVLRAHIETGGGRYRGVRDIRRPAPYIIGKDMHLPDLVRDRNFRAGFKWLQPLKLCADIAHSCAQVSDLVDLARVFPETQIVFMPFIPARGGQEREAEESLSIWRKSMRSVAACPNIAVKLGGHAFPVVDRTAWLAQPPFTSKQLAAEWRPYVESCMEAVGADRCMFVSDFPSAAGYGTYRALWNAYKRLAAGASQYEKAALFSGTATRVYRLAL